MFLLCFFFHKDGKLFEECEGDDEGTDKVDKMGDAEREGENLVEAVFKVDWLEGGECMEGA